jgi:RNA polymerase sigma factor (sigma-70 family)
LLLFAKNWHCSKKADQSSDLRHYLFQQRVVEKLAMSNIPGVCRLHGAELTDASNRQLLERFIAGRDETAFAGLIERHGKMVWHVCRRVLRHEQDIEDAFQAVFLVLARRAASIRKAEAVGSWLYGVAYRIAVRARRQMEERRKKDRNVARVEGEPPAWSDAALRELQRLLDVEVQRLRKKLREPFVLCCLDGMSRAEAARELGLQEGTVASRLAKARAILKERLARHGVALSAALVATALATDAGAAPAALVDATVHAAAAQPGGATGASEAASALADSHLRSLDRVQRGFLIGILLLLTTLFTGTGLAAWQWRGVLLPHGQVEVFDADTFAPPPVALGTAIDERILTVAFAPDGKRLVTAGGNPTGQIQIWDAAKFNNLVTIRAIPGVRSVAYAPDHASFAAGDRLGQIKLCDADTGAEQAAVQAHEGGVECVAYSRDGQLLVSAGPDRALRVWGGFDLKKRRTILGHADTITSVAFFSHGGAIASGSRDHSAIVWDLETGEAKWTLRGHCGPVAAVAVSPDDNYVATASADGCVKLWGAATGEQDAVLEEGDSAASSVAFSRDGTLLAAGLANGTIALWDVKSRKRLGTLGKHDAEVSAVAFSSDSTRLVSGSADKTAKIWHVPGGTSVARLHTVSGQIRPIQALAYSPDGTVLAMATNDTQVQIRNAKTGDVLRLLSGHEGEVNCLAFSSDNQTLATGSSDKTVKLWDWTAGAEIRTLEGHTGAVHALAFSADGKQLASGGEDRAIRLWDVSNGEERTGFIGHLAMVRALAFAPNQRSLASAGDDQVIKIWDLDRTRDPVTLPGHSGAVRALAFAARGILASAGDDSLVRLWDLAQAKETFTLKGHGKEVLALAFTPTGRTLASASRDKTIHVWDSETGQLRADLKGHKEAVSALAMHPMGHYLVSGSHDTMLLRWQGVKRTGMAIANPLVGQSDVKPNRVRVLKLEPDSGGGGDPPVSTAMDRPKLWLLAALIVAVAITAVLAAGVWLVGRRRRPAAKAAVVPPDADEQARLSIHCPGCGKGLRARVELAGKDVKCPNCGHMVLVPPGQPAPPPSSRRHLGSVVAALGVVLALAVVAAFWHFGTVSPDALGLVAGVHGQDDAKQFEEVKSPVIYGEGFFGVEMSKDSQWRWLGDRLPKGEGPVPLKGLVHLLNPKKDTTLTIGAIVPFSMPARPKIKFIFNGELLDEITPDSDRFEKSYRIPAAKQGREEYSELLLVTDQFFIPREKSKTSQDDRRLGVRVTKLTWDDKVGEAEGPAVPAVPAVPPVPPAPQPAVPVLELGPPPQSQGMWLILLVPAVAVFAMVLVLAVYLSLRGRKADPADGAALVPQADAKTHVSMVCSGCGKTVKAKTELQGKKVKCPHCRQLILCADPRLTNPPRE